MLLESEKITWLGLGKKINLPYFLWVIYFLAIRVDLEQADHRQLIR